MGLPFSWNIRSQSDLLSSMTLMTVLLWWLPIECSSFCWAWFLAARWCLAFAMAAVTLPSFLLLKEEFTLLRKAHDSLGLTFWQLSHSVFHLQLTRFFWTCCVKVSDLLNYFILRVSIFLRFLKSFSPFKSQVIQLFNSEVKIGIMLTVAFLDQRKCLKLC